MPFDTFAAIVTGCGLSIAATMPGGGYAHQARGGVSGSNFPKFQKDQCFSKIIEKCQKSY
jgi:hypothetical protein